MSTHFFHGIENFLRQGGQDSGGQSLRHDSKKDHNCGKSGHGDSRKQVGRILGGSRLRFLVDENYLQNDQVIIERHETAKERERDEPEQAVMSTGAKGRTEEIEFSKEPRQRRQTG